MFVRTITKPGGRTYQALIKTFWNKEKKSPRQKVIKWLGRVDNKETRFQLNENGDLEETFCVTRSFRLGEEKYLSEILARKRSVLLYGTWGIGKTFLAQRVAEKLKSEFVINAFYFRWSSPQGQFISEIAEAVAVETKSENDKGKLVKRPQSDVLKDIGDALCTGNKVLIIDKAQAIPVALRNQFEVWLEQGATILLCATLPKRAELFLKFPRYELKPLNRQDSVSLVRATADHLGVTLSQTTINELVTLGNGNPQFLMRAVAENDIGSISDPDQTEWIDGTPIVIGALCLLMLLRFIGRGLHDENLVLMGGVAMVILRLAMLLISRVSKKRQKIE